MKAQKAESLFISVVSIGELERGIERARKSDVVFAAELEQWLETLLGLYADRVLQVSTNAARLWGRLSVKLGHATSCRLYTRGSKDKTHHSRF